MDPIHDHKKTARYTGHERQMDKGIRLGGGGGVTTIYTLTCHHLVLPTLQNLCNTLAVKSSHQLKPFIKIYLIISNIE